MWKVQCLILVGMYAVQTYDYVCNIYTTIVL